MLFLHRIAVHSSPPRLLNAVLFAADLLMAQAARRRASIAAKAGAVPVGLWREDGYLIARPQRGFAMLP
ncbi:hypothetical protein B5U98_24395 [Bosea sp. Tri-39]|nr:hypothetical protein BLM15_09240 [Bosea sp. Tri-49]RXT18396.1 hypothetical protein B5U98_24395 [Bosea sp. Tri-39]RXT32993.1 hypothetical protein B5U99_30740 [Bosea sp. Tri-54]